MTVGKVPNRIEEEQIFEQPVTFNALPKVYVGKLKKGSTTPSVKDVQQWMAVNTVPVTITNFVNGQDGQELLLLGDGQTTLTHGTNIMLAGGVNLLLAVNKVYHLVRFNNKWIQVTL